MEETKKNKIDINLYKIILFLVLLVIIVVAFVGSYSNFNGQGKLPSYKYADILTPYDQYILHPSSNVIETDVYVDENGNTVRRVPDTTELDNIELGTTDNDELAQLNRKNDIIIDDEVEKLTIEKRQIADNEDEAYTRANIVKSQEMMISALKANGITDFRVRRDYTDNKMIVEIPQTREKSSILEKAKDNTEENEKTESVKIESILLTRGTFEIRDTKTGRVYVNEENIKSIEANLYRPNTNLEGSGGIALDIYFDKKGTEVISDISRRYIATTDEEGNEIKHQVDIYISGMRLQTTTFSEGNPIDNGYIQLMLAPYLEDNIDQMADALMEAKRLENAIKVGKAPTVYELTQKHLGVESNLNKEVFIGVLIAGMVIVISLALFFVFIREAKGIYYASLMLGYLGTLVLIVRYTNIIISIPVLVSILVVYILQFAVLYNHIENNKEDQRNTPVISVTNVVKNVIVLLAASIVLSFSTNSILSGVGMVLFMGITLLYLMNYIFLSKEDK